MSKANILALITNQAGSKRLIKKAADITKENMGNLHILHVINGNNALNEKSANILSALFELGRSAGGTTHGLSGENIPLTILNFIKDYDITHVVAGMPKYMSDYKSIGISDVIAKEMPHIEVTLLSPEEKVHHNPYNPELKTLD